MCYGDSQLQAGQSLNTSYTLGTITLVFKSIIIYKQHFTYICIEHEEIELMVRVRRHCK